jgi:type II secretion system protein C
MIDFFNRHFWVVHLLFIACSAWLVSYICSAIIQDQLRIPPRPSFTPMASATLASGPEPYEKYSAITDRNIFNPAERGLKLLPAGEMKTAGLTGGGPGGGKASPSGSYVLVGTITGPKGYSWAILEETASRKQQVYRVHGNLDGGKILSVSRNRIQVERQGKKEFLTLSEEAVRPRAPAAPPTAARQSPPRGEEVKKLSANRYVVNREDVAGAVGDINQFMTQARLKPYFEAGKPAGFSVSELIPGSLMEKLGLKNNDVIKKVNGMAVTRPEDVMQAYGQLQRDANIELEIERGGRPEVLRYEIR